MQRILKHIRWIPLLMTFTILGIASFQYYWLRKAYQREERTMEMRSNFAFRETVHGLQASKMKLDRSTDSTRPRRIIRTSGVTAERVYEPNQKMMGLVEVLREKLKHDTSEPARTLVFNDRSASDTANSPRMHMRRRDRLMQFLYEVESPADSVRVSEIDSAFRIRMNSQNLPIPFTVSRLPKGDAEESFNRVTIGFKDPITYELNLGNTSGYLAGRIAVPIAMSIFLVLFTAGSFLLLYRNLIRQRRLADIKNEFISNITHELKTPIATVSVAIEALRSFNASMDPQKTKEYLDISANELQRLSMLVDKVLKLSMFEKKEVELKYELLDMNKLVEEVTSSMRLQFEKYGADVKVKTEGDTMLEGDRLHLVSVIFNLVDNALKYGGEKPKIDITIRGGANKIGLCISDSGIGVPEEYRERIFEKFFRVPTGNLHNAKGYGLGLSYVAHVIKKHHGTIKVEPASAGGSRFLVTIPKSTA